MVNFSSDNKSIIIGQKDGVIQFYDIKTGNLQFSIDAHYGIVNNAAQTPNNRFIVTSGNDLVLKIWDS